MGGGLSVDSMRIVISVEIDGVGEALRQAREAAGLSLAAAGALADMSASNFGRVENGDMKNVPLPTLIRAASAVDLDLRPLLGEWIEAVPGLLLKHNPS